MTTAPDGLFQFGGVPVVVDDSPSFGDVWFVDGTNGSVGGSGDQPGDAISTVQLGVTAQLAEATALGDIIYVLPGTYSEAVIASTMTKLKLVGVTCGGEAHAVIIHNSAGSALVIGTDVDYTTTMINSALRNICFYTSSTSNTEFPAVRIDTIQRSIINNCKFLGNSQHGAGSITTVGLQLGPLTTTYHSFHEHSTISNCKFGTSGARAKEVDTAIRLGADTVTSPAGNGFSDMFIIDNIIVAEHYGIRLHAGASSCGGSLIARNHMHSHQGGGGVNVAIHTHAGTEDTLMMIHDNRVNCHTSFAASFATKSQIGNLVSVTDQNAVGQYPPAS